MKSEHLIRLKDAHYLEDLENNSVDLVVTSPPYPMIEMWDASFSRANADIEKALKAADGDLAFNLMHSELEGIWREVNRVIKPGGIICVNIGDATRTINGKFQLYANHMELIRIFRNLSLVQLPSIIWRKPTNSPTKFMGSGMLPPNAYVTLEHEYILIFRKNQRREFPDETEKQNRHKSAYFWEERNIWFSDVWFDLLGTQQALKGAAKRTRSGAFPFELPYRLINMFSVKGDTVLDPFAGTGTTMQAAMSGQRNSISYENEAGMEPVMLEKVASVPELSNEFVSHRLSAHVSFVRKRIQSNGPMKYQNRYYGFPVMTKQEENLFIDRVLQVQFLSNRRIKVGYSTPDQADGSETVSNEGVEHSVEYLKPLKGRQLKLF
jgi:DNA modification methylase